MKNQIGCSIHFHALHVQVKRKKVEERKKKEERREREKRGREGFNKIKVMKLP